MGFFDTSYDALPLNSALNNWLEESSSTGEWCTKDFYYINDNDEVDYTKKMIQALSNRPYDPVINIYNHLPMILKFSDNIKKSLNIKTEGFSPNKEDFNKGLNINYISKAESLKDINIKAHKNITFDSVKKFENVTIEYKMDHTNPFNSFTINFIHINNVYNVLDDIKVKSNTTIHKTYIFQDCDFCQNMILRYKKDPISFEDEYKRILDITKTNTEIIIQYGEKHLFIRYLPDVNRFWYLSY